MRTMIVPHLIVNDSILICVWREKSLIVSSAAFWGCFLLFFYLCEAVEYMATTTGGKTIKTVIKRIFWLIV